MKQLFLSTFVITTVFLAGCISEAAPQIQFCPSFPEATLEVYQPVTSGPHPVLVFFPGRAQNELSGTDTDILDEANARGFVAIDVNYAMPVDPVFGQLGDDYLGNPLMFGAQARCAIRYLRAHAAELNIDSDHIGVIGHSLGTVLASYLAFLSDANWETLLDDANAMILAMQADPALDYPYSTVDSYTNIYASESDNTGYSSEPDGVAILSGGSDALNLTSTCKLINPVAGALLQPGQNPGTGAYPCTPWNSSMTTMSVQIGTSSAPRTTTAWKMIGMPLTEMTVDEDGNYFEVIPQSGYRYLNLDAVQLMNLVTPIAYIGDTSFQPPVLLLHSSGDPQVNVKNAYITGRILDNLDRVVKSVIFSGGHHNMHLEAGVGPTARELYYGFFNTIFTSNFDNTKSGFEQAFASQPAYSSYSSSADFFCTPSAAPLDSTRVCDVQ